MCFCGCTYAYTLQCVFVLYLALVRPYREGLLMTLELMLHVAEACILALAIALLGDQGNSTVTWAMIGEGRVCVQLCPDLCLPQMPFTSNLKHTSQARCGSRCERFTHQCPVYLCTFVMRVRICVQVS